MTVLFLVEEEEKEFNDGSSWDQDTLLLTLKHLLSIDDVKNKRHRYSLALELVNATILSLIFTGDDPNFFENILIMICSEMFFAITLI